MATKPDGVDTLARAAAIELRRAHVNERNPGISNAIADNFLRNFARMIHAKGYKAGRRRSKEEATDHDQA